VLEEVRAARVAGREPPLHFIEVMACPRRLQSAAAGKPYGVTGEGAGPSAPRACTSTIATGSSGFHTRIRRSSASTTNSLGRPLSHKAHELLHTRYTARPLYKR